MKLAILFWFYKDFPVCKNRIDLLRRLNPNARIYGLYGGKAVGAAEAERELGASLDDLYVFAEQRDSRWKWLNGDLMIARWHSDRGHRLTWDTVVIVQWDLLMFGSIDSLFGMLRPNEILLSGLRPASEVSGWWPWLRGSNPGTKLSRDAFVAYLHSQQNYDGELLCCLFIVACFSRLFLDRYAVVGPPELGFLEYRVPTLARCLGISFCLDHPYAPWWAADPTTKSAPIEERLLNAVGQEVPDAEIIRALYAGRPPVFHPYRKIWNGNEEVHSPDGRSLS